jgi:hypothetical protein
MPSAHLMARTVALVCILAAGCTAVRREVAVSTRHPASPAAAQAPLPPDSTTLAVEPTPAAPDAIAPHHAGHHAPAPDGAGAEGR